MKKYEAQNIRRRMGCDPRAYANLLAIQENLCAVCQEPADSRHKLVPAGRVDYPAVGQLTCRHCKHVIDAYRRNPEAVKSQLLQQDQDLAGGTPFIVSFYEKRG